MFQPIAAQHYTLVHTTDSITVDCVTFLFIRGGSAMAVGPSGRYSIKKGDIILIGPNVPFDLPAVFRTTV